MENSNSRAIFLSRKEVSNHLKSSLKTVDRLIRDGRIKAFKIGRKVLIYADTVTEENINAIIPKF